MTPRDHGAHAGQRRPSEHGNPDSGRPDERAGNGAPAGAAAAAGRARWTLDPTLDEGEGQAQAQPGRYTERNGAPGGFGDAAWRRDAYARSESASTTAPETAEGTSAGAASEGGRADQRDAGAPGSEQADGSAADGEVAAEAQDAGDDEMDAFFPSVARSAATGEYIAAVLDEDLLVKALAERDEYLDALRRLQAEFDNFRKRTERQLADIRSRASESLLARLLPVLDAIDLALAHGAAEGEGGEALVQVGGLLRDTLAKEGLERIDAIGVPFDPTMHDAVAHVPAEEDATDDAAGGGAVVDEVLRAGYELQGRVLRPAMVKVRG
jgi:molecular chaperone GrpE